MKKLILLVTLLMLTSCAKSIQQKQEEWNECATEIVTEKHEEYFALGEEEGRQEFLNDMCKHFKIRQEACMYALAEAHMVGKLGAIIDTYNYEAVAKPECGEYPVEDKKSEDQ